VTLRPFAVSRTEITNAQYANFVTATATRPRRRNDSWRMGRRPTAAGTENEPCAAREPRTTLAPRGVGRARLPTSSSGRSRPSAPSSRAAHRWCELDRERAHRWTDALHILKGGSHAHLEGIGVVHRRRVRSRRRSRQVLRAGPAIERSSAIGFRCAVDLDTNVT